MPDQPPPWNPPIPGGTRYPDQSEITTSMTAFAKDFRDSHDMHAVSEPRDIDGKRVVARVAWHTVQAATGAHGLFKAGEILFADGAAFDGTAAAPAITLAEGIDVSAFQPVVDWTQIAAAGKTFAFIKATEGVTYTAPTFAAHWAGAEGKVRRGAYHFFRSSSAGEAQIQHFFDVVRTAEAQNGKAELPPVLDVEWQRSSDPLGGLTRDAFADEVAAAVRELAALSGRRPIVYTSPNFWGLLPERGIEPIADLWVARFDVDKPGITGRWDKWTFWQYSAKGSVPGYGVPGHADVNRFCGSEADLRAYAGGAAAPAGPPTVDLSTTLGLQRALNRLGAAPPLDEDGILGERTKAAIRGFQKENGLIVDAVAGRQTKAAIVAALAQLDS